MRPGNSIEKEFVGGEKAKRQKSQHFPAEREEEHNVLVMWEWKNAFVSNRNTCAAVTNKKGTWSDTF